MACSDSDFGEIAGDISSDSEEFQSGAALSVKSSKASWGNGRTPVPPVRHSELAALGRHQRIDGATAGSRGRRDGSDAWT